MIDFLISTIRHSLRSLTRTPVVSTAAILCLAGAIGAATAVFTIVDGVVLRSLPFGHADRMVAIWGADPGRDTVLRGFSWLGAQDLAAQARSLEGLAVMENSNGGMKRPAWVGALSASGQFEFVPS